MVGTRKQNKDAHPAAPVMSKSAKIKAGITPAPPRNKRQTKDEQTCMLQARVDSLEHPDEAVVISKDPLVSHLPLISPPLLTTIQFTRDSSPPEDVDLDFAASEAPTDLDSNDFVIAGSKRISSSNDDPRYVPLH